MHRTLGRELRSGLCMPSAGGAAAVGRAEEQALLAELLDLVK